MSSFSISKILLFGFSLGLTSTSYAVEIPKPVINIPKPVINVPKPNIPRPTINVAKPNVTINVPKSTPRVNIPKVEVPKLAGGVPKVESKIPRQQISKPTVSGRDPGEVAASPRAGSPVTANNPVADAQIPAKQLNQSSGPSQQGSAGYKLAPSGSAASLTASGNSTELRLPNGTFGKATLNPDGTITVSNNNGSIKLTKQQMGQVAAGDMTALKPLMSNGQSSSTSNSNLMKPATATVGEGNNGTPTKVTDTNGGTAIAPKGSAGASTTPGTNGAAGKSSPKNQQNGPPDWTSIPDGTPLKAGTKFSDGSTIAGDCIKMGGGCYPAGSPNLASLANSGAQSVSGIPGGLASTQPSVPTGVDRPISIGSFISKILQSAIVGDSADAAETKPGGLDFPLQVPCPGGGGMCSQSCVGNTCYIVDTNGKATPVPNPYNGGGNGGSNSGEGSNGSQGQGQGQGQLGQGQGGQAQDGQGQAGQAQDGQGQGGQGQGGQGQGGQGGANNQAATNGSGSDQDGTLGSGGNQANGGFGNGSGGNQANGGLGNGSGGNQANGGFGNGSGGSQSNGGFGNGSGGNQANGGTGGNQANGGSSGNGGDPQNPNAGGSNQSAGSTTSTAAAGTNGGCLPDPCKTQNWDDDSVAKMKQDLVTNTNAESAKMPADQQVKAYLDPKTGGVAGQGPTLNGGKPTWLVPPDPKPSR